MSFYLEKHCLACHPVRGTDAAQTLELHFDPGSAVHRFTARAASGKTTSTKANPN
jgi:hypothetical protein